MKRLSFCIPILLVVLAGLGACASPETDKADSEAPEAGPTGPRPTSPTADVSCVAPGDELTGSGLGELQIGMSVDEFTERCHVAADTTIMGIEGQPQRIAYVVAGDDTIRAEIVDEAVWRINIETPTWRTSDSLGIGSTVAELLELPEVQGFTGEGNLVIASPRHCGINFRVDAGDATPPPAGGWDEATLRQLPETAIVDLIMITSCPEPDL